MAVNLTQYHIPVWLFAFFGSFQIERFHYLLNVYVETAKRGEPVDGRLVQHLLHNPSEDGGQWQMLVNLVEKYGVVPKSCFPDTWSSENSRQLLLITNNKVRWLAAVRFEADF
jgi:bleomycin hydrolase